MKKRRIFMLLIMTMLFVNLFVSAQASSGKCGPNANWTFDKSTGVLVISGTGATYDMFKDRFLYAEMDDETWSAITSYGAMAYSEGMPSPIWKDITPADAIVKIYPEDVRHIVIMAGITELGGGTFRCFDRLESVSFPVTLTKIGVDCFWGDSLVSSYAIPDTVTSMNGCGIGYEYAGIPDGDLVIRCAKGSAAYNYAMNHGLKVKVVTSDESKPNGFRLIDSKWKYYQDGKLASTYTGIVRDVLNGKLGWYYVQKGVFTKANGLAKKADKSDSVWYYVQNGIFTKANGIAKKADGSSSAWYYVQNGVFTKNSGLAKKADGSSTTWYYVQNGVFTKNSGLAKKADGSSKTWYYVKNGVFTKASGLAKKADGSSTTWYYVKNGVFTKASGIAKKADGSSATWYYVKDGVFAKVTTIAQKADGSSTTKYYVKSGVFTKFTGKVSIGGKTYNVVNGVVK